MNTISPRDSFTPPGSGTVTRDYPQAVFAAPYFTQNRLGDMLGSLVTDAVNNLLPGLLSGSDYIQNAVNAALTSLAVLRAGDTMTGPLFFTDALPTQDHQAATKLYVDLMLAGAGGGGIEDVPIYPINEIWARSLGAWVPISDLLDGGTTPGGDGTVTSITAGLGLTGGTIITAGTIALANTSVAPGSYTNANITVDQQGRLISASSGAAPGPGNGSAGGTVTQINTGTGLTGGPITAAGTIALANTMVTPGTYQGLTIDAQGRVTAAANAGYVTSSGVTSITAGTGLAGGTITSTGSIGLSNTGVTAGSYSFASITVDAQGRLTAATSGMAGGTGTVQSIATGTGLTGGPINVSGTISLANTAVAPGSYTLASLTVDQQGRLTAASSGTTQFLPLSGGNMQGPMTLAGDGTTNLSPVTLQQLNARLGSYLPLAGGTVTTLNVDNNLAVGGTAGVNNLSFPNYLPDGLPHGFELGWNGNDLTVRIDASVYAVPVAGNQFPFGLDLNGILNVGGGGIVYKVLPTHIMGFGWTGNLVAFVDGNNVGTLQFQSSDAALKEDFAAIEVDPLSVVRQIPLQQFDWRATSVFSTRPRWSCGFTAQDIASLIPEAVTGEAGKLGVDLMVMVGYLIGAVQRLEKLVKGATS